jgi:hypothetical protein
MVGSVWTLIELVAVLPRIRRRWRRRAGGGRAADVLGKRQRRHTSSYPAIFFTEKRACMPVATQRW